MKVATLVLFVAIAGLLVTGAVDAKKYNCGPRETPKIAIALAGADACAVGGNIGVATTFTDAYANTCGGCVVAGASSSSAALAVTAGDNNHRR